MSILEKVGNMQELYSHIDRNSGEKFEDMFLDKKANKGTSLSLVFIQSDCRHAFATMS